MLTQERLKELLDYDEFTGAFTWKQNKSRLAKIGDKAGHINNIGYIYIQIDGVCYRAHRLAWLYVNGKFPCGQIDHINGVKYDNSIKNIRIATDSENQKNRKRPANNKTGFTGIRFCKGKYRVSIGVNGEDLHIGYFKDIEVAIKARKEAEEKYGYHKNHGR